MSYPIAYGDSSGSAHKASGTRHSAAARPTHPRHTTSSTSAVTPACIHCAKPTSTPQARISANGVTTRFWKYSVPNGISALCRKSAAPCGSTWCTQSHHASTPNSAAEAAIHATLNPQAHRMAAQCRPASRQTGRMSASCGFTVASERNSPANAGRRAASPSPPTSPAVTSALFCPSTAFSSAAGLASTASRNATGTPAKRIATQSSAAVPDTHSPNAANNGSADNGTDNSSMCGG